MTKKLHTSTKIVVLLPFKVGIILRKFWDSWEFCGNAQFPQGFGSSARNCAELCVSRKFSNQEIRWNYGFLCSEILITNFDYELYHVNNITLISWYFDDSFICKLFICTIIWHNNNAWQQKFQRLLEINVK